MGRHDREGSKRTRRSGTLGIIAALVAVGLLVILIVVIGLRAREDVAAVRGSLEALARSAANPGTAVVDPTLAAGVVVVDLLPAVPGMPLEHPTTIHVGAGAGAWTVDSPAEFEGLGGPGRYRISVSSPYLAEPVSFDAPPGQHGVRINVRAIPMDPAKRAFDSAAEWPEPPERVLDVELARPDLLAIRWRQGHTVVALQDLGRSPDVFAAPALAALFAAEWNARGGHKDSSDKKTDRATVRVDATTPFADVVGVVEALLRVKRPMTLPNGEVTVSAFQVSVQPPLSALRPPKPRRPTDEGKPAWQGKPPKVRTGAVVVSGRLESAVIQGIVAANEAEVLRCYVDGLRREKNLEGRVLIRFVIGADGAISNVGNGGTDLADAAVVGCIVRTFDDLSFPRPEGGIVTVAYPYLLSTKG